MTKDATPGTTPDTTDGTTADATQPVTLTISDAAKALDLSVRTVQRHLDAGRMVAVEAGGKRYVQLTPAQWEKVPKVRRRGITPVALDVLALKGDISGDIERDSRRDTEHDIERDTTRDNGPAGVLVPLPQHSRSMVPIAQVAAIVAETLRQSQPERPERPAVDAQQAAVKLLLTIEEASVYAGVSRNAIKAAIKSRALKGYRGYGRGTRIKRTDVETWIEKL